MNSIPLCGEAIICAAGQPLISNPVDASARTFGSTTVSDK